jgi:HAD superfamily hydrolase (TIGR01549 family)
MAPRKGVSVHPAFLFDLDGTLIDSVYEHVEAWSTALKSFDIALPKWKIHRRIGMSGKSFLQELLRESGIRTRLAKNEIKEMETLHDNEFSQRMPALKLLPSAQDLLGHLNSIKVRWAIATTGGRKQTMRLLEMLTIPKNVPIVTGDDVNKTKPSPDAFVLAAKRLGVAMEDSIVVGDSVWDLLAAVRKRALGVGLLTGGYGQGELERAGAFRVYSDPADLLAHLEQLGVPGPNRD